MDVEQYISHAPEQAQVPLRKIRAMVRAQCPGAVEVISYRMPAFKVDRVFIYFAAFKKHVGIYPPVQAPKSLVSALKPYRGPKGNLQFPYDADMPFELMSHVIDALYAAHAIRK